MPMSSVMFPSASHFVSNQEHVPRLLDQNLPVFQLWSALLGTEHTAVLPTLPGRWICGFAHNPDILPLPWRIVGSAVESHHTNSSSTKSQGQTARTSQTFICLFLHLSQFLFEGTPGIMSDKIEVTSVEMMEQRWSIFTLGDESRQGTSDPTYRKAKISYKL